MLFPHVKPPLGVPIYEHDPSLGGYWLMNEGTGNTVNDLSGNKYHGTLVGDSVFTASKFGGGIDFAGDGGDYVSASPICTTGNITISVWFRADSFQANPSDPDWAINILVSAPSEEVDLHIRNEGGFVRLRGYILDSATPQGIALGSTALVVDR